MYFVNICPREPSKLVQGHVRKTNLEGIREVRTNFIRI